MAALTEPNDAQETSCAFPLSFGQQRLWFLARIAPDSRAYHLHATVPIGAAVDAAAMARALALVVERHEMLRTTLRELDGEPQQVVHARMQVELPVVDMSQLAPAEHAARLASLAGEHGALPFDLGQGPLLRAKLVRLGAQTHVLLLAMHHVAGDAWSIRLLWRELTAAYLSAFTGRPLALPALEIQYGDYAVWQRQRLSGQALAALEDHWTRCLAGAPTLALPLDHARPPTMSYRGAGASLRVPPQTVAALRALAQSERATLFMLLCGVFAVQLGQWARQDDIVFGTPVNTRQRAELEPLIGFFVNMLVLRMDVAGRPSLRGMVQRARGVLAAAYAHQELPFERLIEVLQLPRDLSRNPLFQVSIQYQPEGRGEGAEAATAPDTGNDRAVFDLALSLWDTGAALHGRVEYDSQLFDPATVQRFCTEFVARLERAVQQPDVPMDMLRLLAPDEEHRLIAGGSGQAVHVPVDLLQALRQACERHAERIAVQTASLQWRYRELAGRSAALAQALHVAGVVAEDRVALRGGAHSPWFIASVWACWQLGAAYVCIDTAWPPARQAAVLAHAQPRLVLAPDAGADTADGLSPEQLCAAPPSLPVCAWPAPDADALAYVLYTSGSTGRPKGVAMGLRAVANQMNWMRTRFALGPDDVLLQKTPVGFDASVWELLLPLLCGARLVLSTPGCHRDPGELAAAVQAFGVTTLQLVPSMLRPWLEHPATLACRSLSRLFVGGEALPLQACRAAAELLGVQVVNLYGPTETCVQSSFHEAGAADADGICPIGRPVFDTRLYVLDERLQALPPGRVGELYIGGAGLARGYWRAGAATAQRFVPDPFAAAAGQRMYRTGDLARWRGDGVLLYDGRVDGRNKLRGQRIDLAEVDAALLAHPDVREAASVIASDPQGDARLLAHVAWLPGRAGSPPQLRRHLARLLPEYMVPSLVLVQPALPLLANGKIDRAALAELPLPATPQAGALPLAPRGALERSLRDIWQDLLQQDGLGVEDDFFADLGGHSLLAVRLNARLCDFFQLALPMQHIFRFPTIAAYAQGLRDDPDLGAAVQRIEQLLCALDDSEAPA